MGGSWCARVCMRACLRACVYTPLAVVGSRRPARHRTHGRHMSGQDRECPDRRPMSDSGSNHWLEGPTNGVRRRRGASQWDARNTWARGFPHMLTLVNCREKELAETQAHERLGAACVCVRARELRLDAPMLLRLPSVC